MLMMLALGLGIRSRSCWKGAADADDAYWLFAAALTAATVGKVRLMLLMLAWGFGIHRKGAADADDAGP